MAEISYSDVLQLVEGYYGSGSDQWVKMASGSASLAERAAILKQVPGVSVTYSKSGNVLGFDYQNPFGTETPPAAVIDSNVQSGAYGTGSFKSNIPATVTTDAQSGYQTMESGAKVVSTGAKVAAVADKVSLAAAGVSLGTKLGKLIDQAIYSLNPQWWDAHFPTINPETWDDMATSEGGKDLIRSIFGLEQDSATMYLPEDLLAYTYMMLLENGAYDSAGYVVDQSKVNQSYLVYPNTQYTIYCGKTIIVRGNTTQAWRVVNDPDAFLFAIVNSSGGNTVTVGCSHNNTGVMQYSLNGGAYSNAGNISDNWSRNGSTVYGKISPNANNSWATVNIGKSAPQLGAARSSSERDIAHIILYSAEELSGLSGVTDDPDAQYHVNPDTLINPTTQQPVTPQDDVADVIQALKTQYPQLFDGEASATVPQDNGTQKTYYYIPAPYPTSVTDPQPTTGPNRQENPQINPQTNPDSQLEDFTDFITTPTTQPPDKGDGTTPPVILPAGSASALFAIYNPTQSQLNSFGAWLWSPNFVDQLLKLFNDPMQAIIGLHKVFAPPVISGSGTIRVGYLDSNVGSNIVGDQYTTVDCGTINLDEYFGNVFDYEPFTNVYIYLPFIGIQKLNTGDVMRGTIGVKYSVDVLTGACLAEVTVTRDQAGGVIYTYAGDCAVQYPISSGSYMGIVASIASIVGGIVGTVATGGALAPVAMGAVSGVLNAHADVNHSGNFSGNAGAMGIKTPYLIISRPQTCMADNFNAFDGYPSNKYTILGSCTGYVKVDSCHVEGINATDTELSDIENYLKNGVII